MRPPAVNYTYQQCSNAPAKQDPNDSVDERGRGVLRVSKSSPASEHRLFHTTEVCLSEWHLDQHTLRPHSRRACLGPGLVGGKVWSSGHTHHRDTSATAPIHFACCNAAMMGARVGLFNRQRFNGDPGAALDFKPIAWVSVHDSMRYKFFTFAVDPILLVAALQVFLLRMVLLSAVWVEPSH